MKKINLWLAAIAAASLVSITAVAQTSASKKCESGERHQHWNDADEDGAGPMQHRHMQRDRLPEEAGLNLTDAQKKTLATARAEQKPKMEALHEKMRAAHEALDKAADSKADDATLTKLSNDLAVLIAQQEVSRIKMRQQFINVLTPEQKQKLDAFKAEHKDEPRWQDKKDVK